MLSPDEHPGIFTFMVGIVVIVMVAVGLSVLMDKKFASSSGGLRLEREVESLVEEGSELRDRVEHATIRLTEMQGPRARAVDVLRKTKLQSSAAVKLKDELLTSREGLLKAIHETEQQFSDYRADYRREERIRATGESLGTLSLRDGRNYRDASITKVTDVGLEIRHEHGFARIHAPDLGLEWQDRFQWDDEERRMRLKEEALARKRMAQPKPALAPPKPKRVVASRISSKIKSQPKPAARPEDVEKLAELRRQFSGWNSKVNRLDAERNEAIMNASRKSSVPGRLETWSDRATRLRGELSKARVGLAAARAQLEAVSPRDPLLMAEGTGNR